MDQANECRMDTWSQSLAEAYRAGKVSRQKYIATVAQARRIGSITEAQAIGQLSVLMEEEGKE